MVVRVCFFVSLFSLSIPSFPSPNSPFLFHHLKHQRKSQSSSHFHSQTNPFMAKTKPGKKDLDSYAIKGTNKVVRPGDCVLMRPSDSDKPPYVARVEKIEADHRNNVKVRVRWYYRPEESIGGEDSSMEPRSSFYQTIMMCKVPTPLKESVSSTLSKTTLSLKMLVLKITFVGSNIRPPPVVSLRTGWQCIANVRCHITRMTLWCNAKDARIEHLLMSDFSTIEFNPTRFHPSCMEMTIEEAKRLDHFLCSDCTSEDDAKRSMNTFPVSASLEPKVRAFMFMMNSLDNTFWLWNRSVERDNPIMVMRNEEVPIF
ncbi:hypothetical protein CXB51_017844 [Gossypium anomalum]|uniref:BAH domain-containing protein n=1 Tax=Gossypium anomalum TaxID=47600 RepID=A0A8J6CYP3_9ROSI|nr:hypothetical protein CXB51_017844 [Gossypium anomalum]